MHTKTTLFTLLLGVTALAACTPGEKPAPFEGTINVDPLTKLREASLSELRSPAGRPLRKIMLSAEGKFKDTTVASTAGKYVFTYGLQGMVIYLEPGKTLQVTAPLPG